MDERNIQHHLGYADLRLVQLLVYAALDLVFGDVEYREPERCPCEGASPRRIAFGHGHRVELRTLGSRCSQDDDKVVFADLVNGPLEFFLTVKVKCACGRSNKAMCDLEDYLGAGGGSNLADRITLDAIPLPQSDNALAFEIH